MVIERIVKSRKIKNGLSLVLIAIKAVLYVSTYLIALKECVIT